MRKNLTGTVTLLWGTALLLIVGLSVILYLTLQPSSHQSAPADAQPSLPLSTSPTSTNTPAPTSTASLTPSPSPTLTPQASSTPYPPEPLVIGTSVAGRPLEVYRFGEGSRNRLIIAGIHGGYEWNTVHLAEQLIDYLGSRPGLIPEDQTLYILKVLNPDGYARSTGLSGRANDHGVDLNRNFPASWRQEWPEKGCWNYLPITGGPEPGSEPETAALMSFLLDHKIESLINYHSAALGIFAGGQPPDPASLDLAESIASVSNYPYPPIDTGCQFTGQLIDWASNQGIAAVDVELTNHQDVDFEQNLAILSVFLDWKPPD